MIEETIEQVGESDDFLDSEQEINQIIREHEEKIQLKNPNVIFISPYSLNH